MCTAREITEIHPDYHFICENCQKFVLYLLQYACPGCSYPTTIEDVLTCLFMTVGDRPERIPGTFPKSISTRRNSHSTTNDYENVTAEHALACTHDLALPSKQYLSETFSIAETTESVTAPEGGSLPFTPIIQAGGRDPVSTENVRLWLSEIKPGGYCVGTVKWFNGKKQFGFLADDSRDYFVPLSSIQGYPQTLNVGESVEFEVVTGPMERRYASNVVRLSLQESQLRSDS
jgi:cold shock CspA family protein